MKKDTNCINHVNDISQSPSTSPTSSVTTIEFDTTNILISEILPTETDKQSEASATNEAVCQTTANQSDPELIDTVVEEKDINLKLNNESNDLAEWKITADHITFYAENIQSQNLESDFQLKGRQFGDKIRYARKEYFVRKLTNGEIIRRDWLIYSHSTGKVFCYVCKLFG